MTILEILEAHLRVKGQRGMSASCICGWHWSLVGANKRAEDLHRAHVAELIDQRMREREAEALTEAADALDKKSSRLDRDFATENGAYLGLNTATTELRNRAEKIKEKP